MANSFNKIAIIGNGGGGKTTLGIQLSKKFHLPLTHVDSIQYLPGMQVRAEDETRKLLNKIAESKSWLIDGFGPLDVMEYRFRVADKVIFIDFPIWRHYWWCTKRQFKSIWFPRAELPAGCYEATFSRTIKLYKILWRVHKEIRPKLLRIFDLPEVSSKIIRVKTLSEWSAVYRGEFR